MMKINARNINYKQLIMIGLILMMLVVIGIGIYMYNVIQTSKESGFEQTKSIVRATTEIDKIEDVYVFQSEVLYHIVLGKTKSNEKQLVFLPIAEKDNAVVIPLDETITEEAIIQEWQGFCSDCSNLKVNYAMIDDVPLWELTYVDETKRYVFDYFTLDEGEQFEQLRLSRKYK